MKVTAVELKPVKPAIGTLLALATIVIEDEFIVRKLRVMDGEHGLFVGYPNDVFCKEEYKCICQPITRKFREHIENTVLEAYQKKVAND